MKVIKHDLGDFEEIKILALSDWHVGDPHSDGNKIKEYLDFLRQTPNAFALLNGDLMNCAVKNSISDVYSETVSPMEALKQCVKLFDGLQDKILYIGPGNHELRIWKNDGVDLTQLMATQLGIGEVYSPTSALLFVRFGHWTGKGRHKEPLRYTVYVVHGSGGGRLEGSKINRLMQLQSIVDADIYIHSHVHTPAVVKTAYYRTSLKNSSVQKVDKLFINTAAALEYGGYGELASYKPASMDTPIITLNGNRRKMTATL